MILLCVLCMLGIFDYICVCNDTSTPEIDTYVHTRPLHDALPICTSPSRSTTSPTTACCSTSCSTGHRTRRCGSSSSSTTRQGFTGFAPESYCGAAVGLRRSEEHTSELQSLMRTSYAVFRLENTKIQPPTDHSILTCILYTT